MTSQEEQPKSLLWRHRQLAPTASVRVSPLCLGSMSFGTAHPERYGTCDKETSFEILDYFLSQGGNFIDSANAYRDEQSETWLGEWMASRGVRDQMVLATKYSSAYRGYDESVKIHSNYGGNGTKSMRLSLEASLRKLQTTYIDLFYVHWWDYSTGIPELMQSLNDLVVSGKVLYLGISDTPAWIVSAANQYAKDHGLRQFSVYQGDWSCAMRDFERDIIPMAKHQNMALCPFGTLNQGRFQTEAVFKERETNNPGRKFKPTTQLDKDMSKVLERIANRKGNGTLLTSVALAYCLQKTTYVFPIIGGRKVEHLKGNIEALKLQLTESDIAEIEAANPFEPGFPHNFLSGTLFQENAEPKGAYGPSEVWLTKLSGDYDWVEDPKPISVKRE